MRHALSQHPRSAGMGHESRSPKLLSDSNGTRHETWLRRPDTVPHATQDSTMPTPSQLIAAANGQVQSSDGWTLRPLSSGPARIRRRPRRLPDQRRQPRRARPCGRSTPANRAPTCSRTCANTCAWRCPTSRATTSSSDLPARQSGRGRRAQACSTHRRVVDAHAAFSAENSAHADVGMLRAGGGQQRLRAAQGLRPRHCGRACPTWSAAPAAAPRRRSDAARSSCSSCWSRSVKPRRESIISTTPDRLRRCARYCAITSCQRSLAARSTAA